MSEAVRGPIRVRSAGSSARSTDGVRLQAHRSTPRRSGRGAGSLHAMPAPPSTKPGKRSPEVVSVDGPPWRGELGGKLASEDEGEVRAPPSTHARSVRPVASAANEWPREESNLRTQIRSLPLYPLSYGADRRKCCRISVELVSAVPARGSEGGGGDSNPRPPGPQPGALPAELPPPRTTKDSRAPRAARPALVVSRRGVRAAPPASRTPPLRPPRAARAERSRP